MANATHASGYYYDMQFGFQGIGDICYTGLQPRPDALGQSVVHAVFSNFVPGTTTLDVNCFLGADGGPGVSCSVDVVSSYAHTYNMVVQNIGGTTWQGTLVDTVTGVRTHIGTWTLPSGAAGLSSGKSGFIEYYPWNEGQSHPCSTLPWTKVFFGVPKTSAAGAVPNLGGAYEYGNCVGQVNFQTSKTASSSTTIVCFP